MMKQTSRSLQKLWGKTMPIFNVLMSIQPGQPQTWAREMAVMHENHILTAGCWQNLSDDQKKNLPLGDDIRIALDKAIAEGLGRKSTYLGN